MSGKTRNKWRRHILPHPSAIEVGMTLHFTWICSGNKGRSVCHNNMHQVTSMQIAGSADFLAPASKMPVIPLLTFTHFLTLLLFCFLPLLAAFASVSGWLSIPSLLPWFVILLPMAAFRPVVHGFLDRRSGALGEFSPHFYFLSCGWGLPAANTHHLKSGFCLVMTKFLVLLKFCLYGIKLQFLWSPEQSKLLSWVYKPVSLKQKNYLSSVYHMR